MSSNQRDRGARFRALHEREGAFVIPNPWDLGSARVLAALGFEALATTSSGFAFTLGRKDGATGRAEALAHVRQLSEVTTLPISADLENCFADDPETAADTIRQVGEDGAVGCSIEDWTGADENRIYDFNHAVERVAAAVEASRALPFPFTLTARAENLIRGRLDLDDTVRRLQAFEKAGADVLYAPGLKTVEDVKTVCSALARPVNVLATPGLTAAEIAAAGGKRISLGSGLARVAIGAFLAAAREMKDEGSFAFLGRSPSLGELNELLDGGGT